PTGNLDPDTADSVLALLQTQVKTHGAAAIMVTHSHAAAAKADKILVLTRSGLEIATKTP
ncbi:MAG TPA: ABC transporter ATP-binding protein, partial [Telluria sp.]|nr:ABC transporter ATP-binding protein [Telluria sp.]